MFDNINTSVDVYTATGKPYENRNSSSRATHVKQHGPSVIGLGKGVKTVRLIIALFKLQNERPQLL